MAIINKKNFLESLSDKELKDGYFKFNIPDENTPYKLNGEGVWGWLNPEDKAKYKDDNFTGQLTAILCNDPINYGGLLSYGSEVKIACHGDNRPTLDPDWIKGKVAEYLKEKEGNV